MLTQQRLKELLHYDPDTGDFVRLVRTSSNAKIGDIAGAPSGRGYLQISIDGKRYYAHRLAWLYMTGDWPKDQIDHRSGVRNDNRFANLREATSSENHQNYAMLARNKSGFLGVIWHKQGKKWMARITDARKARYLGLFTTPEEAHAAYRAAKAELHPFQPIPRDAACL